MLPHLFSEKRAAQVAAYFLFRAARPLSVLKLMKLLYLAERRSFEKYGEPLIGDRLVSMPHGPVLSNTYSYMNGELQSVPGGWETWIADREGHEVSLRPEAALNDPATQLTELSESDLEVLDETWERFGALGRWELRDYTHDHCPEWTDPEGSSIPMDPEVFLKALGYSDERARATLARLKDQSRINRAFNAVKS